MTNTGLTIVQRALLSGEDLSAGTIAWGRRPERPPRFALTDRDLRLMALLYGANFLSTSHLTALGWGFSQERAAQMRLKRLHDAGYVDHFRPVSAYGRVEWNYRLTSLGFSALRDCEMVTDERRYTPVPLTSISYAQHDVQLASVVLRIAQEAAVDREAGTDRADAVSLAGSAQRAHRDRRGRRDRALSRRRSCRRAHPSFP